MKRRRALTRVGTLLLAGLAGCLGGDGGATETTAPETAGTATPPFITRLEVLERACGEGENSASVAFEEDGVRVDGTIGGSDTCDTAELDTVDFSDGTLSVAVATVQETVSGTPACGQCLTDIDYRMTIQNAADVDTIVVRHDGDERAMP
jgi:hypothetical protein